MKQKFKRKRLWVDPAFQFRLLVRLGLYFLFYIFVVVHIGFAFHTMAVIAARGVHKGIGELYVEFLSNQRILLITLVLTAPIIFYSMLKFSHRVAGPLFRCRKVMQEMAEGNAVPEFIPRQKDLMRELFQAFNGLIREWNSRLGANLEGEPKAAQDVGKEEHFQEPLALPNCKRPTAFLDAANSEAR
jgi:hypothetical protein